MENLEAKIRVYDGSLYCGACSCGCPVAEFDPTTGIVTITDPAVPENGKMIMTRDQYNAMLMNAHLIP
jgi:hypothetical protein